MRGGILDRVDTLEKEADDSKSFRTGLRAKIAVISALVGFGAAAAKDYLLHK